MYIFMRLIPQGVAVKMLDVQGVLLSLRVHLYVGCAWYLCDIVHSLCLAGRYCVVMMFMDDDCEGHTVRVGVG